MYNIQLVKELKPRSLMTIWGSISSTKSIAPVEIIILFFTKKLKSVNFWLNGFVHKQICRIWFDEPPMT